MNFKQSLAAIIFAAAMPAMAYTPLSTHLHTPWAEEVTPENARPEYPRPIMERPRWMNLNGLWQYAITDKGTHRPSEFQGDILVPYPVESDLSGVGKRVGENKELWYTREFTVPQAWGKDQVMLNFGAVDWKTDVWVNGIKVGTHTGGFTPFSFNITDALNKKGANTITVKVWDPTDRGTQPRGKQVENPNGIWYTPVTGIWQTVWLEPVSKAHIASLRTLPDIDSNTLSVTALTEGVAPDASITTSVVVKDNGKVVAQGKSINNQTVEIEMPDDVKLWSPDAPNLYDMEITLTRNGQVVDKVNSYAAMRKFSTIRDDKGLVRLALNNKPIFQFGPLDQGWWPDGLYTAPTHEAMVYDLDKTKELGYNMLRKHIKVEPATWYTYCDRNGIIVWQDMPSGDAEHEWQMRDYYKGVEPERSAESEANYRKEWKEIMDCLYSYPCIGMWIPFNERWGQFKTVDIAEWTKQYDPSRPVNPASGGNFFRTGDVLDVHSYPHPEMYLFDAKRANVIGEYGGIGLALKDHLWWNDRNWGYVQFNTPKDVTDKYEEYINMLYESVPRGVTGAVYTQTTDVEGEVNGLLTYDRKVTKVEKDRAAKLNRKLAKSLDK
ncbi:MAG: beta galactosidase jelly roll domain-containing protein [Muribaculum sp.]